MALTQRQSTLSTNEINSYMKNAPMWVLHDHSIVREFIFKSFQQAISFVNHVADLADAADHHPDIFISYNKVKLEFSTHSAGGLTSKDFELAAKVDRLS